MTERMISASRVPTSVQVLGYAPGYKLHLAALDVKGDRVLGCEFFKFFSIHEAVAFFVERPRVLGIGLNEILAVGTGREGWRPADFWIDGGPFHFRSKFDEFPFFWGPFQVQRSLEGIALLSAFRRRWPGLGATETMPEESFMHLARVAKRPDLGEGIAMLGQWLGVALPEGLDEYDWRAAMSAYAMWMGLRGEWPIDLNRLSRSGRTAWHLTVSEKGATEETYQQPALSHETLIYPAGPVSFFWPPGDRAIEGSRMEKFS